MLNVKLPTEAGFSGVKITQFAGDSTLFMGDEKSIQENFPQI